MAVLTKHQIIQMIERKTGNYHYPVTLYEAIQNGSGESLEDILRRKLLEFGLDYDEIVNKKIDDSKVDVIAALKEGDIKEVRESITMINNKLNRGEVNLSYLAYNWLIGVLPLDVKDIADSAPNLLYLSDDEEPHKDVPVEEGRSRDYWMSKTDNTVIKMKSPSGMWVTVSENTAIALYGLTTSYAREKGYYRIDAGVADPPEVDTTDKTRVGDIYLLLGDTSIIPYVWLGTMWSTFTEVSGTNLGEMSQIDDIVDLTSVRHITIAYSMTESIGIDYRFDGTNWHSAYPLDVSIKTFLRSILPSNLEYSPGLTRRVYICPKKPTDATEGDAWVDTRNNCIYINVSDSEVPKWVQQINSKGTSSSDLKCTNLYAKTESFNGHTDLGLWKDIRTGSPIDQAPIELTDGFGIQDLYGANKSIGQVVTIKPNTVYTYSVYMKPKVSSESPVIKFIADGCEIHETSILSGSPLQGSNYQRVWMMFTTGPDIRQSTCRIETQDNTHVLCYAPCLQEGFNKEWSPSFIDANSGFGPALEGKEHTAIIYRDIEDQFPSEYPPRDSYLLIKNDGSVIKSYERNEWINVDTEDRPNIKTAIDTVCGIYTGSGITKIYTRHLPPTRPDVGDFWIKDDLSVVRFTGSSWGSISGVIAETTRQISARLMESNNLLMQSIFLESSITPGDLLTLAQQLDPEVTLYQQGTAPVNPRAGDIWENTTTGIILRYDGNAWTPSGGAKISAITQSINGLQSNVSEIYEGGSGRNYIRGSTTIAIGEHIQGIYDGLDPNTKYVFSVGSSIATGILQYTVRIMDPTHTFDYDNKVFTVGNTVNIWRFDTSVVPAQSPCDLVVTYSNAGSNVVLTHVQLEKGSIYTDWKLAIEDVESNIDSISDTVTSLQTDIATNRSSIDNISQDLADAIRISNEAIARAVTVDQTAESFSITATALTSTVGDLRVQLETYSSVFDFRPEGLQISSLVNGIRSDISTYYRSNGMYFWSEAAGSDVGYVTSDGLNIRNAKIQLGGTLSIGNFHFRPRDNGALSLVYRIS